MTKTITNRTQSNLNNGSATDGNHIINDAKNSKKLQARWAQVDAAFQEGTLPKELAEAFKEETMNSLTATAFIEALRNSHNDISRMVFQRSSGSQAAEVTLEPPALYEASTGRITFNPGTKANITYYPTT